MAKYAPLANIAARGNEGDSGNRDIPSFQSQHLSLVKLGIERSGEAIFLTDLEGKILYVNPAFEKIYGYSSKEVVGNTPRILKSGYLSDEKYAEFWKRLLNKEVVTGELINKTKNGHLLFIESAANPVLDETNQIIGFLAIQRDITERKRAEEALRDSEERFRGIFENATIGLYRTTPDGRILMANPTLIRMLGYSSFDELAKRNLELFGHSPQSPRSEFKKMTTMMGVVHGLESSWKKADGSLIQVLESASAVKDKNGDVNYYEGTVEDITERKRSEEALRDSEERYRQLIENANDAIFVIQEFKIIFVNYKVTKLIGHDKQDIIDKPFSNFIHPDDKMMVVERHRARLAGQQVESNYSFRVLHKDGSFRWIEINLVQIEWHGKPGMLVLGRDITQRKIDEEALRNSEDRYKLLIENAKDVIFVTREFNFIFANNKIFDIIGYRESDVIGKPFASFIHPEDRELVTQRHKARMAGEKVESTYSFRVLHRDGSIRWLEINAVKIDWHGKPATLNFGRDITQRKKDEEALKAETARAQSYLNTAGVIFVAIDSGAKITLLNRKGYETLGYGEDELIGKDWFKTCIPPEEYDRVRETYHKLMAGEGEPVEYYENRIMTKTGGMRIVAWHNTIIRDSNGKIMGTLSSGDDITERKQTETQLQVEKAYFEQLFKSAPEAIVVGDPNGKITRTNPEFSRIFGYREEEAIGNLIDNLLAPGDLRNEAATLTEKVALGQAISSEGIRYRKDGKPVHVSILGTPIGTGDGQIAVYAIYRDITEQKRTEELIEARTQFLARLVGLTNASDLATLAFEHVRHLMPIDSGALSISNNEHSIYELVYSADTDENGIMTVMTNRGFIAMDTNSSTVQVFRRGEKLIIHRTEEEAEQVIPFIDEMPAYNTRVSRSLAYFPLIVHGRTLGVFSFQSYQPEVFTESRITLLESIMADLSLALTAVRMTEAVQTSEEKYRSLVETMPNGLVMADTNQIFTFANRAACLILGYQLNQLIGMHIRQIIVEDDMHKFKDESGKREDGKQSEYEISIRRGDGTIRTLNVMAAPIIGVSDEVRGTIGIFNDVTELKNYEAERQELREKLSRAQRMESLGVLAGGVAHDLNNILGPLVAYPELIRMKLPHDSPIIKQITKIESSAQRAADVVQDLLALARRGRYEMKPISLDKVVDNFLQSPDFYDLKMRCPDVSINVNLEQDDHLIYGSEPHLYKVIMNLALNAMDAMPHGGLLGIKTECCQISKLAGGFDNIEAGLYKILTINDTGVGIDPKDVKRLFEPFYTKKEMGKSGSGLGLAIVYGVIKDHNGYIDVRSEINRGSEFSIYIPATSETATSDENEPVSIRGTERILIVDDVPELRELAVTILSSLGYKAECVPDGHAAVEFMKSNSVDVVLLDMIMEPGFDGLDTYKGILELHPGQKAIITSGFSETDRVKEAERLGVGKYIRKPYTMQKLGKAIREVMDTPVKAHS